MVGTANEFYPTGKAFDNEDGTILSEITCEPIEKCDRNQITFKAYFASWLAFMTTIVPSTANLVLPKLKTSAVAAAKTCTGLSDGAHCGIKWYTQTWDGTDGLEQQMAVLGVLNANLVPFKNQAPFTADTGGLSKSNPTAGTNSSDNNVPQLNNIKTSDRAGAGVLTVIFVVGWGLAVTWMIRGG